MSTNLKVWSARVGLLGVIWLAATGHGCATEQEEGDYSVPPHFSVQQTRQVALSGHHFLRDDQRRLRIVTSIGREHLRKNAGVALNSIQDTPTQRGKLEAVFHETYADGLTIAASTHPEASLRVVPVSARKAPARLRNDGAIVAYENAFPNVTSAYGGRESKIEEFLLIPSEKDIPELAYDLYPGADFASLEEEDGRLWAYAQDGAGLFTIEPPFADDAAGKRVTGSWGLESHGNGYRITAKIDLKGLAFPVLLDPTFETPAWFRNTGGQPSARAAAAGTFDLNTRCSLIFGGATNASFNLANDLNIRCTDRRWKSNLSSASPPPARAYSAMGYFGGSTRKAFLFGGYGNGGPLNDLWRADLTCTTPGTTSTCTVNWTQITTTGGPSARFLHGMAWNGSKLMVFGGVNGAGQGLRDTWEYDADTNTWAQACTDCFGESFGFYGFATTTLVDGTNRSVLVSGGYSNPAGGGDFLNTVSRWNNGTWEDASGVDMAIPANQSGGLTNGIELSPTPRYLHWMAATGGKSFVLGSGTTNDGSSDTFFADTWLWQDRTDEGYANQWLRQPVPSGTPNSPGTRESATAIFDENRQEVLLFGGLTNATTTSNNGRVYRPIRRDFTMTQSCTNNDDPLVCDGNAVNLTVTFPGLTGATTPKCADMRVFFLRFDALAGTWGAIPSGTVTASFSGTCTASISTTWDPSTYTDYGVRVQDKRYHSTIGGGSGTECLSSATEVTATTPKASCLLGTSSEGSASCGFSVLPDFGFTDGPCELY